MATIADLRSFPHLVPFPAVVFQFRSTIQQGGGELMFSSNCSLDATVCVSDAAGSVYCWLKEEQQVQILVRDNNVDQALKVLKKKMQREGVFREMKIRLHYEKPSEKRAREKSEAIRRARKLARKKLQREGLLPMKPRRVARGASERTGPARGPRF